MAQHDYLLLKNPSGLYKHFEFYRGMEDTKGEETEKHYDRQKRVLAECMSAFYHKVDIRHSRRAEIPVRHIDYVRINFLKQFDESFAEKFIRQYGLEQVSYSNMNKTATFAVFDEQRFEQSFCQSLKMFSGDMGNDDISIYKDLTTIKDFEYLDNEVICKGGIENISGQKITLHLTNPIASLRGQIDSIRRALSDYLKREGAFVSSLAGDNLVQLSGVSKESIEYILSNFDIILSLHVQSCRRLQLGPSEFGTVSYSTGLSINVPDGIPTIGVIDTGARKESPCAEILTDDGIDISDALHPNPFYTGSEHGTSVSCLAAFGLNMYKDFSNYNIEADARVYTIKILDNEEGKISGLLEIKNAIVEAISKGIRIFNLSVTTNQQKEYNSGISEFGYVLDQLAYDYDILIFISTGNLDMEEINELQYNYRNAPDGRAHYFGHPFHFFYPDDDTNFFSEETNLYAPADSMNNMTVGAIADNLNDDEACDLSQRKDYPAIYTLKGSNDYNRKVNDTFLNKNQRNKNLYKPDIVMPGGDLLDVNSKMQVIGINNGTIDYVRNSGTSYSAPLAANLAAKILRKYPAINMQTVKAIIINSTHEVDPHYLDDVTEDKKRRYCQREGWDFDRLDTQQKRKLSTMFSSSQMNRYLTGHGCPDMDSCLYVKDDNSASFIIEDEIDNESYKVINLNLPEYLYSEDADTTIHIKATLCYKFNPVLDDIIGYNPVHISFNIMNSIEKDNPQENAKQYSMLHVNDSNDTMRIKGKTTAWSEDFFPVNNRIFSNVQTFQMNINSNELRRISGQVALVARCACKHKYEGQTSGSHPFSLVLNITENRPKKSEIRFNLYNEIVAINRIEAITEAEASATLEA